MSKKENKKIYNKNRKYILEALEKLPSPKVLCAVAVAILVATILYLIILFFLHN